MIILIASSFVYVWAAAKDSIKVGPYTLNGRNKSLAVIGLSLLTIFIVAGSSILVMVGFTAILIAVHAVAHEIMLDADLEEQSNKKMVGTVDADTE